MLQMKPSWCATGPVTGSTGLASRGLGIGDKLTHGEPTGELALRVYVEEEAEGNGRQSRAEGGGCPRGRRADNRRHRAGAGRPRAIHRAGPAGDAGLGLGHTDVTVGTFGCLVRRRAMNGLYVLSNSHVLANEGIALPGDGSCSPVHSTVAIPKATPSRLTEFVPFEFTESSFPNLVDAAIARVRRRTWVGPKLRNPRHRPGWGESHRAAGHAHQESGPHGLHDGGHIRRAPPPGAQISPANGHRPGPGGFMDQVLCTRYGAAGDSGSVILNSNDKIVGLHFAGATSGSVFNRITHVFELLDIEVA